jgi:DNA-binding beta-propeller fold protein YncE
MKSQWITPLVAALLPLAAAASQTVKAPKFEVDPLWPKPLPNRWLLGSAVGLAIDSHDHIWVVNLTESFTARTETGANANPPIGECCFPSPNVLEFDPAGNLVGHWGGPGQGFTWPSANTGIAIAPNGNVWVGGTGPRDTQILEFTANGQFVRAIGAAAPPVSAAPAAAPDTAYAGVSGAGRGGGRGRGRGAVIPPLPANSASTDMFGGPAGFSFDAKAGDAFVADGSRNHRIAVVDLKTGAIKQTWGAGGKPADDAATGSARFANPVACAELSNDGLVYVCDRANNRIQVFKKTGELVKEASVAPNTKGAGSVWDITFSRDPQQQFLYVADGQNMKVHILDRQTLQELSSFGEGGRQPGEFFAVHSIATDSKGNVYTVESLEGKRLQKFVFKGVTNVPRNQGVTWAKAGGKR